MSSSSSKSSSTFAEPMGQVLSMMLDSAEKFTAAALPSFLWRLFSTVIFPGWMAIIALGGVISTLHRFWRLVVPAPTKERYRHAKTLYRQGRTDAALQEWTALPTFGPAYLSRATHALYVQFDPQMALKVLRLAKQAQVRIQLNQVETIQLDAQALQAGGGRGGNMAMLDMNGRSAKQDHLGISSM